jgi:phosphoglycerol transferase MdoB-like AlkP superfamily enzyme
VGNKQKDLAGSSFTVDMVPDLLDLTQISGSQWPDTLYQDQFDGTHEPMDDYDITTKTTASWVLSYQN